MGPVDPCVGGLHFGRKKRGMMSEGLLFTFGAVIFFIVFGGATLFGMASLRKYQEDQK